MSERTQKILLHCKYLDDEAAAGVHAHGESRARTGVSVRITARTEPDGRRSAVATVSERGHFRRASGKVYARWQVVSMVYISRTKRGLVVRRRYQGTGIGKGIWSEHLFANDVVPSPFGCQTLTDVHQRANLEISRCP